MQISYSYSWCHDICTGSFSPSLSLSFCLFHTLSLSQQIQSSNRLNNEWQDISKYPEESNWINFVLNTKARIKIATWKVRNKQKNLSVIHFCVNITLFKNNTSCTTMYKKYLSLDTYIYEGNCRDYCSPSNV